MADIAIENDWKGPLIVDFPKIGIVLQDYSTIALFNIAMVGQQSTYGWFSHYRIPKISTIYPLVMADIAIENDWKGPLIVDFPIKNRDFPTRL